MVTEQQQLLSTVREIYGRVAWTHKTHEKQRELSSYRYKRDNWINVVLTSLTTIVVIASIPLGTVWATVISGFFAFATTLFAVYRLSFSPENEAQAHRQTAKALLIERDRLVLLIERSMSPSADIPEIRRELSKAVNRLGRIYSYAPDTSSPAYILASRALKSSEELTFSTAEIDALLPPELRLHNKSSNSQT